MAVDEAQHINARREVGSWQLGVSSWQFIAEQFVTENIEDLEGAYAVDDEVAVADESEVLILNVVIVVVGTEHQFEATLIVRRLGLKGVTRGLGQVDVGGQVDDTILVETLFAAVEQVSQAGQFRLVLDVDGVALCAAERLGIVARIRPAQWRK